MRQNLNIAGAALLFFVVCFVVGAYAAPSPIEASVRITPEGSILTADATVIPPFPVAGKWTELEGKSSARYEVHQFIYFVPNASPAIELYAAVDRSNEIPDGVFERGLVQGYLKSFASKAGLQHSDPVFADRTIGRARAKCTMVKLSVGPRSIWIYAYIFVRKPSLTFIAIRAKDTESKSIEDYLAGLELK